MKWNNVRYVTVHKRPGIDFIVFFAEGFEERPLMQGRTHSTFWMIDLKLIDETFIFVEYRDGMLDEVKKYWDAEIINKEKLLSK